MLCLNIMIASLIEILSCLWKNAEDKVKESMSEHDEKEDEINIHRNRTLSEKDTKFNSFMEMANAFSSSSDPKKMKEQIKNFQKMSLLKSKKKIKKADMIRFKKKLHKQKSL